MGQARRVLVIEDDRFNRRLFQDLLEAEGLAVELVSSAREGLAAAHAAPPDLVVMDLELPDVDGVTATAALRGDPRTSAVPVLVVSAHAQVDQEARAVAAGAAGFLRKPLRFPDFQQAVLALLDQR
ncbi:MAG: response regulator [Myxococcales bacterium]|nr:response regulator [Myxococcales bacterium]